MLNNTIVISLTSSKKIAQEVCDQLGIPMGKAEVYHFADGEILVELGQSVRGKNVYIIQSTCNPVSNNLMEVLIAIDACKRASAEKINVVMPYFGYARQDRKAKPRQPITAKLVADMLEGAGASRIITMELHATQIQGFFDVPADDISGLSLIGNYIKSKGLDNVVVVSPDHGGTTRARKLAELLHAPLAIIDKRRTKPNVAEAMNILGDVKGKRAIIIDDIVDTAGTLMTGINMLYEQGAIEVYASCIHGVLSGPAIERINNSKIVEFITTNTIPQDKNAESCSKMTVISVGELLGRTIKNIEEAKSVSEVIDYFSKQID